MAQYFEVHPEHPQPRLLKQAADILHKGGVVALPTDSSYALVCHLDDKAAAERLRRIRGVDDKHHPLKIESDGRITYYQHCKYTGRTLTQDTTPRSIVVGSNSIRSAALPTASTPRSWMPKICAGRPVR